MNTNTFFWILQISKKLKVLSTKLLGGLKFTLMMKMVWFHFLTYASTSQLFINFNRFSPKTMLQWHSIWSWLWSVFFLQLQLAMLQSTGSCPHLIWQNRELQTMSLLYRLKGRGRPFLAGHPMLCPLSLSCALNFWNPC